MLDMREYSQPVHRSLLTRELILGVPQVGLVVLFLLAVIFCYVLGMVIMLVPIVILYFVMKYLTKKDLYMIDIVLDNISQKDVLTP